MPAATKAKDDTHQDKLNRLTAEVDSLRHELRHAQRLAAVGTMTAMVAHEFNNILTPIINYAQLAKSNPRMVDKAIDRASEGGQRATEICKAILGITRDQSAQAREQDMTDLVGEVLSAMARPPRRDGIDLVVTIPAGMTLHTRKRELQQILLNLVMNARTAVLAKPVPRRIELSASRTDDHILIRVSDNGVGIAPELLEKVFEPFFTTSADTPDDSGGHGLGLAICRDIIGSLGGQITLSSTVGQGATFTLRMPV